MTRMIPLLAVAAVALCVALVIVVISVMTGFLDMIRSSGQTLMGDVVITYPIRGIPYYDSLISTLEQEQDVKAATPVVDTWGLLRMPYPVGDAKESEQVQIWGIDPQSFSQVTGFAETLKWSEIPADTAANMRWDRMQQLAPTLVANLDLDARVRLLQQSAADEVGDAEPSVIRQLAANATRDDLARRLLHLAWQPDALRLVIGDEAMAAIDSHDPRLGERGLVAEEGRTLQRGGRAAIVSGLHVSKANERKSTGEYDISGGGYWWMPNHEATLTTLPIDSRGGLLDPKSIVLPFANEFASGVFLIDQTRIMVPLQIVQDLTNLDSADIVDPDDPTQVVGHVPAKATMILVRGQDGIDPVSLRSLVQTSYRRFQDACIEAGQSVPRLDRDPGLRILTWEEQNASFIGPVEKERELMRTLFSIVYLVCGALIVAIFWAIVYEKTRDIGILRSIGASRMGIVWIFLLYGLFVGVFGALAGICLGWLVTVNMPAIHEQMSSPPMWLGIALLVVAAGLLLWTISKYRGGQLLPVLLGTLGVLILAGLGAGELVLRSSGGIVLWDPAVYYFTDVPDAVDWPSAWITAAGAVICSVVAAAIPAARAADIDPVGALRYE
ncbi:MAG: ABC transporter permease [Phycisphaerales bacterium]|jgi:lipoprotein-releasing system permease protein|nr:ABC transporter permease [Phycisphaerales bacterium]